MTAGAGLDLCRGCGAEVVFILCQAGAEPTTSVGQWGVPVPFERLMIRGTRGELGIVQHLCRDYGDWHRTRADKRGVEELVEDERVMARQASDQDIVGLPTRLAMIIARKFALCG